MHGRIPLCLAGFPSCIQSKCIQKPSKSGISFVPFLSGDVCMWTYACSYKHLVHSQRFCSSTVSTGLSTIPQAKNGGFSWFPLGLSTLSTGYPQMLSSIFSYVDIHVDSAFCSIFGVYTCYKFAYLFRFVHVPIRQTASFGMFSPENHK